MIEYKTIKLSRFLYKEKQAATIAATKIHKNAKFLKTSRTEWIFRAEKIANGVS